MKIFSTTFDKRRTLFSTVILLSLIFIVTSISRANSPTDSLNKDSQKYLSFYEIVDGESVHWEANFYSDNITSIYKNGKRIPDELVDDYKDKIYNELDDMRSQYLMIKETLFNSLRLNFRFNKERIQYENIFNYF